MTNNYDLVFSMGPSCRPAYYLELTNIRKCAYPFDWLGIGLDAILDLFKNDFKKFFNSYEDISDKWYIPNLRTIIDNNDIVAAHHIKLEEDLETSINNFKMMMSKRFKRLKDNLDKVQNIALITNRNIRRDLLKDFIIAFSSYYPTKNITLINVRNE